MVASEINEAELYLKIMEEAQCDNENFNNVVMQARYRLANMKKIEEKAGNFDFLSDCKNEISKNFLMSALCFWCSVNKGWQIFSGINKV